MALLWTTETAIALLLPANSPLEVSCLMSYPLICCLCCFNCVPLVLSLSVIEKNELRFFWCHSVQTAPNLGIKYIAVFNLDVNG